jgi:DNA-binding NtrC family response regulator
MVVDDEVLIGRALKRALGAQDEVAVCQSAFDALDLLEQNRDYHLILCDLSMPGMTGAALYERIAQRWPDLKDRFIVMTGGASTMAAREFLDGATVPKLDKPLDLAAVRSILDRVRATVQEAPVSNQTR